MLILETRHVLIFKDPSRAHLVITSPPCQATNNFIFFVLKPRIQSHLCCEWHSVFHLLSHELHRNRQRDVLIFPLTVLKPKFIWRLRQRAHDRFHYIKIECSIFKLIRNRFLIGATWLGCSDLISECLNSESNLCLEPLWLFPLCVSFDSWFEFTFAI